MVRRVASPQWRHKRAAEAGYLLLAHRVECLSVRIARRNGFLCHQLPFLSFSVVSTPMTFLAIEGT